MQIVKGTFTNANIMTDIVEDYAVAQIQQLCNLECMQNTEIVCMPDIHPGKVATIGFTAHLPLNNPVMPTLVGNDIGCGVMTVKVDIKRKKPEFQKLDKVIRENVPTGYDKRKTAHKFYNVWKESNRTYAHIREEKASLSLRTLGSGNHFIELDQNESGEFYLTIHTGSRSLGQQVFEYWRDVADEEVNGNGLGRTTPIELTYLSKPENIYKYLEDCKACIEFAHFNRLAIVDEICSGMKWKYRESYIIDTHHNFVEVLEDQSCIIRKGAIASYDAQPVIIPINMKDGVIIGTGKSNPKYNYSAPHGAGRIASREKVKALHTLKEYKTAMNGIYSPTINKETLDEAPFAYKSIDQILPYIDETVNVNQILKPVYNYKGF